MRKRLLYERDGDEKKTKKKRKRGRERRSVARPTTTRESRGPVFVVSFLFRLNLFLFFFVRRASRLIQTHLVSLLRESSLVLRCARNTNTNTNTTGHTRARAHLSSLESRLESRRKVAGKCEKNKRERAATVRVFERRKRRFKRRRCTHRRIGRDEESTRKINTREAWKRTKNSSNSSKDTHRTAQTHARTHTHTHRERERERDNTQREIE